MVIIGRFHVETIPASQFLCRDSFMRIIGLKGRFIVSVSPLDTAGLEGGCALEVYTSIGGPFSEGDRANTRIILIIIQNFVRTIGTFLVFRVSLTPHLYFGS